MRRIFSTPSIVIDQNGSEILGNTTVRNIQMTSQTFVSFLVSDQHHDSILRHNQGGSDHRMSNAIPTSSSNVITCHENEPMGGLASINLFPPRYIGQSSLKILPSFLRLLKTSSYRLATIILLVKIMVPAETSFKKVPTATAAQTKMNF
jgi:hypothetical protein